MQTNPWAKWHCWHLKHNLQNPPREQGTEELKGPINQRWPSVHSALRSPHHLDLMLESLSINRDLMGGCGGLVTALWNLREAPDGRVLLCCIGHSSWLCLPGTPACKLLKQAGEDKSQPTTACVTNKEPLGDRQGTL